MLKRVPFVRSLGSQWNEMRWLQRARTRQSFAQNGEDAILFSLFPKGHEGTYIDLGCNHPYRISNTYLLYENGWRGLCVDPIPMFAPMYRRHRPRDVFLNAGVGAAAGTFEFFEMNIHELSTFSREIAEELVAKQRAELVAVHSIRMQTVSQIVATFVPDGAFDVLSIDIEGLDAETVQRTDWGFVKPRVVICETSSYEHDWSAEIVSLMADRGYRHERHVGCNDLFLNTLPGRRLEDL
jgi:FkbM family methyltransferase